MVEEEGRQAGRQAHRAIILDVGPKKEESFRIGRINLGTATWHAQSFRMMMHGSRTDVTRKKREREREGGREGGRAFPV